MSPRHRVYLAERERERARARERENKRGSKTDRERDQWQDAGHGNHQANDPRQQSSARPRWLVPETTFVCMCTCVLCVCVCEYCVYVHPSPPSSLSLPKNDCRRALPWSTRTALPHTISLSLSLFHTHNPSPPLSLSRTFSLPRKVAGGVWGPMRVARALSLSDSECRRVSRRLSLV
jgi:hypothetical protein